MQYLKNQNQCKKTHDGQNSKSLNSNNPVSSYPGAQSKKKKKKCILTEMFLVFSNFFFPGHWYSWENIENLKVGLLKITFF